MAASGYTPISLYYSTTASAVPTAGNLANGELALNIADMKLYAKNSSGVVTLLASNASTTGVDSLSFGSTGLTPSTATTGAITVAGTLNVANGGTGLTSLTAGYIPFGNGTSALSSSANLFWDSANVRLGIGTSSPVQKLTVAGNILGVSAAGTDSYVNASTNGVQNTVMGFNNSGSTNANGVPNNWSYFGNLNAYGLKFLSNGSVVGTWDTSGNLGIGTSSPVAKLQIKGTGTSGQVTSSFILENGSSGTMGMDITGAAGSSYWRLLYGGGPSTGTNTLSLGMSMVLEGASAGNVGIGTTSPTARLEVKGAGGTTGKTFRTTDVSGNETFALIDGGNAYLVYGGFSVGTTANAGVGGIYATGAITAYYSDERLKDVKGRIQNALAKVRRLSGVYYTNNETAKSFGYTSDEVQVGVLANQMKGELPEIVKPAPFDLDEKGNSKSGQNYMTVQYERGLPLLIEAIKELADQFDDYVATH